jgi:RNA polymerase sigma-70 factor (ECF subfamily)
MLSQNQTSPVNTIVGDVHTLKSLIQEAKNGNSTSFGRLYMYLYTPLYRYVYSRTHSKELTEDICQNTFIRFYEALPRYEDRDGENSLLAYLFTIAKRLIINEGTKKKSITITEEEWEQLDDTSTDIVEESHVKLLAEHINEYLDILSDIEEDVIRLFYYAELTHKEISAVLYKEEFYIRKVKERALSKLRKVTKHLHVM